MSFTVGPYDDRATDWHDFGMSVDHNPLWGVVESGVNTGCCDHSEIGDRHPSENNVVNGWWTDEDRWSRDSGSTNAWILC